jgi:hypothetical protein
LKTTVRWMQSPCFQRGVLWFCPVLDSSETPRNLLAIWKRRAVLRMAWLLRRHGSWDSVAVRLYNTNRCGIAHGTTVIRADITLSYFQLVRDAYVAKLLARLAIDEKLGLQSPTSLSTP